MGKKSLRKRNAFTEALFHISEILPHKFKGLCGGSLNIRRLRDYVYGQTCRGQLLCQGILIGKACRRDYGIHTGKHLLNTILFIDDFIALY